MRTESAPLFVCYANCCRSVLARYLYENLCNAPALSAGVECGGQINDRADRMLQAWGIDATSHRPRRVSRHLCDQATAIFVMAPPYLHRIVSTHGEDLAARAYLFADPFTRPESFADGRYEVADPSFDHRPTDELLKEFGWMRDRVLEIRLALVGHGRPLVPASDYLDLCKTVDPWST